MNQKEFIQFIKDFYAKNLKIAEQKNKDYAGDDTFKSFKVTEAIGNTTVEQGMIVRMGDKLARISTLINTKEQAQVKNESIEDSLADLSNYAAILAAYLSQKPQLYGIGQAVVDALQQDEDNSKANKLINEIADKIVATP